MGHLKARAVALDATRHNSHLIQRQETADRALVAVEEYDIERRALVLANDAQRCTRRAFRSGVVTNGRHHKRRHGSRGGLANGRRQPAVEIAVREMPKKIDDPRRTHGFGRTLVSSSSPRRPRPLRLFIGAQSAAMSSPLGGAARAGVSVFGKVIRTEDEIFGSLFKAELLRGTGRDRSLDTIIMASRLPPPDAFDSLKPSVSPGVCQRAVANRPQRIVRTKKRADPSRGQP